MQRFATRFQGKEFRTAPRIGVARSPLCKRKGVSYRRQLGKILNLPDFLKMVFKLLHGLSPTCAAADQRVGLDFTCRFAATPKHESDRRWVGLAFTCRSRRHSTTNSTGPDFSPYHLGSLCCVECFRSNSDAYCSRAGSGRTSTCSTTSFAIHGTVTELDLQRRIRLFP